MSLCRVDLCVQFPWPARLRVLRQGQRHYVANIAQACGQFQLGGFFAEKKILLLRRELHFCCEHRRTGFEGKSKSSDGQALKAFQVTKDVQGNYYWVVLG